MRRLGTFVAGVAVASLLGAADAPVPPPMAAKGPWVVNAAENLCMLARSYPAADGPVTLAFQPLLDLPTVEMFVVTSDRSTTQRQGIATATVGPVGTLFKASYYSVAMTGKTQRVTRLTLDRAALDSLKDGDTLRIVAKPIDQTFAIVRPEKARPALAECQASLEKSWGIDPDAPKVTPLGGNPAQYFGPDTYPREALSKGIYGRVVALLQITPTAPSNTAASSRRPARS